MLTTPSFLDGEQTPAHPDDRSLQDLLEENDPAFEAIVVEAIVPHQTGQVRWEGVFWNSRSLGSMRLSVGETVRVLCYRSGLLWVSSMHQGMMETGWHHYRQDRN